jgi:hypothetical protein
MRIRLPALLLAVPFVLAQTAFAQERPGPGRFELGAFPVGGIFFTNGSSGQEPDFGNFALGGTVTYRVNRWVGVEGEFGNAIGVSQNMRLGNVESPVEQHSPCMYAYSGNFVVTPLGPGASIVPYLTAGAGGITMLGTDEVAGLGITNNTTFLTGNAGGGTKWYLNDRWGVRADYRLVVVDNKAGAPAFFGRDSVRYGHRVYGGLLFSY